MIIVIMGVTGAGKTTVGRLLAQEVGWHFMDGDEFHPRANVEKMRSGFSLNDEDRQPWLERLRAEAARSEAAGEDLVLACSALKKEYRQTLGTELTLAFVYLKGSQELFAERLGARRGHFADAKILAGQFADLEEPNDAVAVDAAATPNEMVTEIRKKLGI